MCIRDSNYTCISNSWIWEGKLNLIVPIFLNHNFLFFCFSRKFVSGSKCSNYADLGIQLDVFQEQRENDEAQILDSPYGVDLNSHVDVFYAILRQVGTIQNKIATKNGAIKNGKKTAPS